MKNHKNVLFKITSLVSSCVLLMLTTTAHANQPPDKCPSVGAIIAEKFDQVGPFLGDGWVGFKDSRYDTNDNWSLTYMAVSAKNEQEAREKLIIGLSSLHFEGGPEETRQKDIWGCLYMGIDDTFAFATTPPSNNLLLSSVKLKRARKL